MIEALAVFDPSAQSPIVVEVPRGSRYVDGDIGEEDQRAVDLLIVVDDCPEVLMGVREAQVVSAYL